MHARQVVIGQQTDKLPAEAKEMILSRIPLKRYGQPQKGPCKPETDGEEEHRKGEISEISEGEGDDHSATRLARGGGRDQS